MVHGTGPQGLSMDPVQRGGPCFEYVRSPTDTYFYKTAVVGLSNLYHNSIYDFPLSHISPRLAQNPLNKCMHHLFLSGVNGYSGLFSMPLPVFTCLHLKPVLLGLSPCHLVFIVLL